jgi:ATP-dependent DNA helicase RecG
MTATPIPRTIALTMFGDLDISRLTEKPQGRVEVKTWLVPTAKREASYTWISQQVLAGSQVFWICPFISESENQTTIKSAISEFEKLSKIFSVTPVGLLHGKLKAGEKEQVLADFRSGKTKILVSTPIVEVGIDIPTAHLIVIESADRFGLAQLHQLRGRVGRSDHASFCLLFTENDSAIPRLSAMEKYSQGHDLAEIDLKLRGPGEIYGTAQHGYPQFKVASFSDLDLIEQARREAELVAPQLDSFPLLRSLIKEDKIHLVDPN